MPGAFEPSTFVRGPLPGKRVTVSAPVVLSSSVRLLAVSEDATARLPLYVARDRAGRLCVGTTGTWECLDPIDAQPAFSFTLQGGHGSIRDWGAVVGIAAPDVRVTVEDQRGSEHELRLRRFRGFPWAAFASRMYHDDAPSELHVYDRAGHELSAFTDLAFAADPCPGKGGDCTPQGEWHSIGDPLQAGPGSPLVERAKRIAFADPFVRRLLSGRRYAFGRPATWSKCSGGTIGAVLSFHFAPARFSEDWPSADYEAESRTAYVQHVTHYAVRNVTQLDVSVDTNRGKVVGVDPTSSNPDGPQPKVSPIPYYPVGHGVPGGGPDSGDCSSSGD